MVNKTEQASIAAAIKKQIREQIRQAARERYQKLQQLKGQQELQIQQLKLQRKQELQIKKEKAAEQKLAYQQLELQRKQAAEQAVQHAIAILRDVGKKLQALNDGYVWIVCFRNTLLPTLSWQASAHPSRDEALAWKISHSEAYPGITFTYDILAFNANVMKNLLVDMKPTSAPAGFRWDKASSILQEQDLKIICTFRTITHLPNMRFLHWVQYFNGSQTKNRCQNFCLSDVLVNALHLGYGEIVPLNRIANNLETRGIGCSIEYETRSMVIHQRELTAPTIPDATPSLFLNEAAAENMINAFADKCNSPFKDKIVEKLHEFIISAKQDVIRIAVARRAGTVVRYGPRGIL